jgi:hypothetical protein
MLELAAAAGAPVVDDALWADSRPGDTDATSIVNRTAYLGSVILSSYEQLLEQTTAG